MHIQILIILITNKVVINISYNKLNGYILIHPHFILLTYNFIKLWLKLSIYLVNFNSEMCCLRLTIIVANFMFKIIQISTRESFFNLKKVMNILK